MSRLTRRLALPLLSLAALPSQAVIVRGTVTDPLGVPVVAARIQLIQGQHAVAFALSGPDGSYEIRSSSAGRFLLLASSASFAPNIGRDFYGGRTEVLLKDVTLEIASVTTAVSVTATGIPTPLQQLSSPVTLIPQSALSTRVGLTDELRQSNGVAIVQTGQYGGLTSLFVRGGNSDDNKVLIDGIPAEDVGGRFDFGTVSSTGLAGIELYHGPDSVLYGTDASASVLNLATPRGASPRPVLNYSGDAGNLHSYRNEAAVSGTFRRLDYYTAFSRFDTSNALPRDEFHAATSALNLGYTLPANTIARFTLRNAVSATGLPNAYDFYHLTADGKQSDQDLYSGLTLENRAGSWHNLLRYGIARKREQAVQFTNQGQPITFTSTYGSYTSYFGNPVTVTGANGFTASGQAQLFNQNSDGDSNRDELYFQSDYTFNPHIAALFGFRYDRERGSFQTFGAFGSLETIQRPNFEYTLQFQGAIRNRVFYSAGGAIEKNHLYGIAGTPRLGLAYVPVRPGRRIFRGTKLRFNVATGVKEPSLAVDFNSLYTQLALNGDTADIAAYHITPIGAERSRTYDLGVDQNILREKLILKLGYFHNIFDHQVEGVQAADLTTYFHLPAPVAKTLSEAYLNSLAFRAQGLETEVVYQPFSHISLRGGYTYLASTVIQSYAGDVTAANSGNPTVNPNYPNIPIGALSPLIGAHPFRRPTHTGFVALDFSSSRLSLALKAAMASRSDDSTFLGGLDLNSGNTLLLPNHNLDFGYTQLDLGATFVATRHLSAFAQLDNLLNNQHIGPIGFPGLPFTVRSGLKLRLGGE